MLSIWRNLKCISLSERRQFEKSTNCDSHCMTFWKRPNSGVSKRIGGWQGCGGRREMRKQSTEDSPGFENTLRDILTTDMFHCTFVQTHRKYTRRANCKITHGFGVVVMCQCRFTLGKTLHSGERCCGGGCACARWGHKGNLCISLSISLLNLKLLLR